MGQWPRGLSWFLEVRVLARRLYEAHFLVERVVQTKGIPGVSRLPPEAPGGLGTMLWSWGPPSTEWVGRGAFCTLEKPEGRGWPRWLGGLRSTEEELFPQAKAEPLAPWLGLGLRLSSPGHSRGKTKGGQGMVDSAGDHPSVLVCDAFPQCLVSRTVLCTNRRHLARGEPPLKPSLTQSVSS